ncbi:MAG: glycosyl hydrolase [Blastocatellia bacterium]|nr:glycosyl hydrolase [Blastocatellia bacterium]
MTKLRLLSVWMAFFVLPGWLFSPAWAQQKIDFSQFKELKYRNIGPFRGGRVTAVTGVSTQPDVYYFGATGGGVWKTTDAGTNWAPMTDGALKTGSVGAIAVAESDPNVVYVGMGESPLRGNVSHGDGMYKSTDAGKSWKHLGLDDTRHIARVRVHPKNPDVVYVAALGHAFGPNDQRGVYRSTDGGKSFQQIFTRGPKAGAIDLALDPTNPKVLYAGFWEVIRKPYTLESGGPGSGLFKSTDGGDTWNDLTRKPGMPKNLVGKVGVTISPVNPERVWAIVEAEDGGVFRSENGGENWTRVNEERRLRQRAWYYTRIYADPQSADTVYVLNTGFYKSIDGGRTFAGIPTPHGDNHDLWIAPSDARRMIESNDGGAQVSRNGGKDWTEQDQPTAQFYRVALDQDFPYHVYGAQQDNSTVKIASRTSGFGIDKADWYDVGGGESGWIAPHPKDSNVTFAGSYGGLITRYDHRTGQTRDVSVWPDNPMGAGAESMKYRFQWNAPLVFSPHEAATLYAGGNILFKSTNEGQSWEAISPDLTRNDPTKLGPSGGPITKDNTSVEYYCTIFTVMESPVQKGVIWTGSDDGLVHVTKDGGKNWDKVTPKDLPEWAQINSIEASPFDPGTAYVAATMYKWDDFKPYLFKTTDYGKSWKRITEGIPANSFTRVIREDPNRRDLLFAGTETGMFVSFNGGGAWQSLQLNLPVVPITDLAIHKRDADLVVATQGRSFWILDDMPFLHQISEETAKSDLTLLKPEDAYRTGGFGGELPPGATLGANPPNGVVIGYWVKAKPKDMTFEIMDSTGKTIRKVSSGDREGGGDSGGGDEGGFFGRRGGGRLTAEAGFNRWVWNLRYEDAKRFPGMILWTGETRGPVAVPGTYSVKLTVDGKSATQTFSIRQDPRLAVSDGDYAKQLELLLKIRDKLSETHEAIIEIRDVNKQIDALTERLKANEAGKPVTEAGKKLKEKLKQIEETLYQTKNQSSQDPLNFPIRLNNKLAALADVVGSADGLPTNQAYAFYEEVTGKINAQLQELAKLKAEDLAKLNQMAHEANLPSVFVKK